MGAPKAAFQISVVAEVAAMEKVEFGAGLLDLVKAFETVPHHILVAIAIQLGYPLVLLRLCLASYRIKRTIGIEGVYSKTVVATRGITAGSGTAATELKLLLLPLMKMLQQQWAKTLVAKVYVDDLTLLVRGSAGRVLDGLSDILNFVIDHIQNDLEMIVSTEKSTVVASKPSLAVAVAERVVDNIVKPAAHAKILGADTIGGTRRCTYQLRSRLWNCSGKVSRFAALREAGANVMQMVRAVASPSILYAVECIGISCAALQTVRAAAASACTSRTGGKNIDLVWAAFDGPHGTADPAFDAHTGPIKYWAIAFWEGWFPSEEMDAAFNMARTKLNSKGRSVWARVTGPATALVATLKRIQWTWVGDHALKDDIGNVLILGLDAPKTFTAAAQASVRRWRVERLGTLFPQLIPQHADVHTAANAPTILLDMFGAIAPLLKGKNIPPKMSTTWSTKWRASLMSAINGGQ